MYFSFADYRLNKTGQGYKDGSIYVGITAIDKVD